MKFNKYFFTIKVSLFLLFLYAFLIALATFVENSFGTPVARYYIYNTRFFDILNFLLIINGIGVLLKYKTLSIKKITISFFHLGFVVVIIGAGITRFYGQEGILHLRENEQKDYFLSQKSYVNISFYTNDYVYKNSFPVEFNYLSDNNFNKELKFGESIFKIKLEKIKVNNPDTLYFKVTNKTETKNIIVVGKEHFQNNPAFLFFDNTKMSISYGAKQIKLPFSVKLNNFDLKRYPGSDSPSSYKSNVTITDKNKTQNIDIYMNHFLLYKGYRLFQASYDSDEQGSIISVNHDSLGTIVTYTGYAMLFLGMFFSIFNKNSRFRFLIKKINTKSVILTLLFVIISTNLFSQNIPYINKNHANKFGELYVLDFGGRIKPVNTLTNEILRKLTHKTTFNGLTSDQFYLSLILFPEQWTKVPLIKLTNPIIIEKLKIKNKYVSLDKLYKNKTYVLLNDLKIAYKKNPANRNQYDRDIIKLDDDVNVLYMAINNDYLKIFPDKNSNNWLSVKDLSNKKAVKLFTDYLTSLKQAVKTNNWEFANKNLDKIKQYQLANAKKKLLNETKLKTEIFYNKTNIFRHLFELYLTFGVLYLFFLVFKLVYLKHSLLKIDFFIRLILYFAFTLQTAGLIVRWYISGHAPWSDGYESMIYIAWATQFAGIFFSHKNKFALASTTLLAGIILLVSHLSWINPEITNLVPVLKSFWLTIHVAIITGSYGFLGMSAILGFVSLILMSIKNKNNFKLLDININQITNINELSLIIGLYMLTIGTFLGGVWANESWGRYWGWDPKETWALVSVLIYAIVAHFRLIPKLNNKFIFNVSSFLAFGSIIITYFGVNFYLSGLHSYAKGSPVLIPWFVYVILIFLLFFIAYAYNNNKRFSLK